MYKHQHNSLGTCISMNGLGLSAAGCPSNSPVSACTMLALMSFHLPCYVGRGNVLQGSLSSACRRSESSTATVPSCPLLAIQSGIH